VATCPIWQAPEQVSPLRFSVDQCAFAGNDPLGEFYQSLLAAG
jgi:hypothetical protein